VSELHQWPFRGHLRILATPACGRRIVAPLLNGFHAQFPEIALELLLSDQPADFIADRIDVSLSEMRIAGSEIVTCQLAPIPLVVCASAAYARMHGLPEHVDDLADHRCINFSTAPGLIQEWEFKIDGYSQRRQPFAQHIFNDMDLIVQAVCAGLGIAQLPQYQVRGLLAQGILMPCLTQYAPDDGCLYLQYQRHQSLPAYIRLFAEYMSVSVCKFAAVGVHKSSTAQKKDADR
jgi:DNA-binding transcriptional LysR family regulator